MTDYQLGDQVTTADYLLRVTIESRSYQKRLAELWPEGFALNTKAEPTRTVYRTWMPATVVDRLWKEHNLWLEVSDRYNPHPDINHLILPAAGVVCGRTTLQNGRIAVHYEDDNAWLPDEHRTAYRIAYNLGRLPVLAWPDMLQPREPEPPPDPAIDTLALFDDPTPEDHQP